MEKQPVYLFDLNGTTVDAYIGEQAFMENHPDIREGWVQNKKLDEVAAAMVPLEMHAPGFNIGVQLIPAAESYIHTLINRGSAISIYSSGSPSLINSAVKHSGLEQLISSSISANKYDSKSRKNTYSFVDIYRNFDRDGKQLVAYIDDGLMNVMSALYASQLLQKHDGAKPFRTYLLLSKKGKQFRAGLTQYGFYVINDFDDIEMIEAAEERGEVVESDYENAIADARHSGNYELLQKLLAGEDEEMAEEDSEGGPEDESKEDSESEGESLEEMTEAA